MKAIAARSINNVIGKGDYLPWPHNKEDLSYFKKQTLNQYVLFGRKTFDSVGCLYKRNIIVLSRQPIVVSYINNEKLECQVWFTEDISKIKIDKYPCWLAGGAALYEQFLVPLCDELHLTTFKKEYEGDKFFPKFEDKFKLKETVKETEELKIEIWKRNE